MGNDPTGHPEPVWLRSEYAGRDDVMLLSAADIAILCGIERSTVRAWISRYRDFPEPVREVPSLGPVPTRQYDAAEVTRWVIDHRVADDDSDAAAEMDAELAALDAGIKRLQQLRTKLKSTNTINE